MTLYSKLFMTLTLSTLFACTTPVINPNIFLSPESSGGTLKGSIYTGFTEVSKIQTAEKDSDTPQYSAPNISNSLNTFIGGELGLIDSLDLFSSATNTGGTLTGLKYQFYGDSIPNAKKGNFSISLASAILYGSVSTRPEASIDITYVTYSGWRVNGLLGYRAYDSLLIYSNPFWQHTTAKIEVVADSTQNSITPNGSGNMYGLTLGGRWFVSQYLFLAAESSIAQTEWTREQPSNARSTSFNILSSAVAGIYW